MQPRGPARPRRTRPAGCGTPLAPRHDRTRRQATRQTRRQALRSRTVRTISLHDSRSGQALELAPRDPGRVGIYACGPTVYSRVHVGNARPFVVFSLLKRFLEHEGLEVEFCANITDVNYKIYDAAREAGVPSDQLSREMTEPYVPDTERPDLGRPNDQ